MLTPENHWHIKVIAAVEISRAKDQVLERPGNSCSYYLWSVPLPSNQLRCRKWKPLIFLSVISLNNRAVDLVLRREERWDWSRGLWVWWSALMWELWISVCWLLNISHQSVNDIENSTDTGIMMPVVKISMFLINFFQVRLNYLYLHNVFTDRYCGCVLL